MENDKIEQNRELVEELEQSLKRYRENGEFDKAVEICEKLVFEFDYFGYRYELPELYNKAGLYQKTISFVNSWMLDDELGDVLLFDSRPIICLGDSYFNKGDFESAIRNYNVLKKISEYEIYTYPNAADIENKKFNLAVAETKIGKVYYSQKNYTEAHNYFKSALDNSVIIDAVYYIAHMCNYGEGLSKDIDMATIGYNQIVDCNISENQLLYGNSDMCILNANYELGMIYATEKGYIDKEKAVLRLNRAKDLGYKISKEEIDSIIEKIILEPEIDPVSYSSNTGIFNVLLIVSVVIGLISIFADLPVLFWICILLFIVLLIAKKIYKKINNLY